VKKTVVLAIAFVVVVLAVVVYTTMGNSRYSCEVDVIFHGRQARGKAAASTQAQAERTATENACAQIASGVTESMACESTQMKQAFCVTHK
jgi:hypothetical protein